MNFRPAPVVVLTALAAIATYAVANQSGGSKSGVSPAPDMPGEWFFYRSEEQAAPARALIGKQAAEVVPGKWFQGEVKPEAMKDKIVILDFWATWCAPCKAAMPHTDAVAKKYANKGVVVAAICSDGDESAASDFIAEKKLALPMAWDEGGKVAQLYNVNMFPTYVAIDRKGIIRAVGFRSDAMEKVIDKLLGE